MEQQEADGPQVRVHRNVKLESVQFVTENDGIRAYSMVRDLDTGEVLAIPGGFAEVVERREVL